MPKALVFETPGLIDLRAFTLMGASVKVGSNPIGQFGTGLKYAVASLARWGSPMQVLVGTRSFHFVVRKAKFRDRRVEEIALVRGLLRKTLPYTTTYGLNWKPWMIIRELEANTRDEGGRSFLTDEPLPRKGVTQLIIRCPEAIAAWKMLHEIFLVGGRREGEGVQVIESPSHYIYWRGLRVLELPKPAIRTYNILDHVWLTEDRTIYAFQAEEAVAKWTVRQADIPQIKSVITATAEQWEHKLNLESTYEPSEAFHECMTLTPKGVRESVVAYYAHYKPVSHAGVGSHEPKLKDIHPFPWTIVGTSVRDQGNRVVFEAPAGYVGDWARVARLLLARLSANSPPAEAEVAF